MPEGSISTKGNEQALSAKKISAFAAALAAAQRSALFCFLVRNDLRLRFSLPLKPVDLRIVPAVSFGFQPDFLGLRFSHSINPSVRAMIIPYRLTGRQAGVFRKLFTSESNYLDNLTKS